MPGSGEASSAFNLLADRGEGTTREEMIAAVDEELMRLREILALLRGATTQLFAAPGAGNGKRVKERRMLTPAGRMRISEAQKRRWQKQRSGPYSLEG